LTDSGWLFLNTPLPYLGAMYFLAYRHDLGRIVEPFHDLSSNSEWHAVFKHLDLGTDLKSPKRPPLGSTRNLPLVVASLVIYAASVFASLFLAWYFLCAIQAAVAVPLFALLVTNRTGPFPFRPYRDVLPYPRLGARIRDLSGRKESKPGLPAEPGVSTTGAKP
jgi:hypothetical protein